MTTNQLSSNVLVIINTGQSAHSATDMLLPRSMSALHILSGNGGVHVRLQDHLPVMQSHQLCYAVLGMTSRQDDPTSGPTSLPV